VDREERNEAVEELKGRVEDWKGHKIEAFGDLLLHGTFTVLKGDISSAKNNEREVMLSGDLLDMTLRMCADRPLVQDILVRVDSPLLQGD
jgi:cell division control protein 24